MNQQVQKTNTAPMGITKPSALNVMAARLSVDPVKLTESLKATVFKNATNEELMALVVVANAYDLNPFLKEIYAFPAKGGGIIPIVSVDGWNKMLLRQPDFDGIEFSFEEGQDGIPYSCTATIHIKGRGHAVVVTEYYAECVRNTDPWKNMPRRMLRNRTLCQASRIAFGFSGVHNPDEAAAIVVESAVLPPKRVNLVADATTEAPPADVGAGDPPPEKESAQVELSKIIEAAGFTFDQFRDWAASTNNIPDADSLGEWGEIKAADARRILRMKAGMIEALQKAYPKSA